MDATRDHPAFTSIVVGTDGSERAGKAVRKATHLARSADARLDVVSAYRPVPEQRLREQRKDVPEKVPVDGQPPRGSRRILKEAVDEARGYGVGVSGHARETDPASALLDVAEEREAELLVVGNKGMRGARRYLGSVPSKVSHHASCSVLIVDTA